MGCRERQREAPAGRHTDFAPCAAPPGLRPHSTSPHSFRWGLRLCRPSGTFPKAEKTVRFMLENSKKRFGRKCSRVACGLAEGALNFIQKRVAEMSRKCKHLNRKCSKATTHKDVQVLTQVSACVVSVIAHSKNHRLKPVLPGKDTCGDGSPRCDWGELAHVTLGCGDYRGRPAGRP